MRRQINDAMDIPALRVKAALTRLTEIKRLKHVGGSGPTTTYEIVPSPEPIRSQPWPEDTAGV